MQLLESKSLLAKLMATENLVIEQRNVQTASFDVKNRVLVVPVLDKNITGYTYDLFMGHEVGHALYTPENGLIKAFEEKIPQSISNVVEDSRIERKIKFKYPGLNKSFARAYNELVEKDFFGTKGIDLNELNFIDRVNMHCKGGAMLGIKFDVEEKVLLKEVETTETYDDVLVVCRKIIAFMKEQEEERKSKMSPEEFDEEDEESDGFGNWNDFEEFDEDAEEQENDENSQSMPSDTNEGEEASKDDELIDGDDHYDYKEIEEDKVRAFTDEAFKQNEKKLFAENATNYTYGNIPKFDMKKGIMPYKQVYKRYKESTEAYSRYSVDVEGFQKLRRETNKVVSYLVKEFELRKNADQLKRASTAKTGDLDMKKIFSYQFSEDIFKKITVLPGGKSHGLVMFLDWSGSMHDHLENTFKQLVSLVLFCKKVNIPYEVYSFATPESYDAIDYNIQPKKDDIATRKFYLLNLLSSKMTAGEFSYACSALTSISAKNRYTCPNWMALGGTPLNEAVIAAMEIVPEFQKQYKLQVVNTVFLTDGEGNICREVYDAPDERGIYNYKRSEHNYYSRNNNYGLIIRDPLNKNQEVVENIYKCSSHTSAYVNLLKARTGCNVLGFYVISGREFGRKIMDFYPKTANFDLIKSNFRKNKYAVVTNAGFDEYYILRSEALDTEESNTFEVKENATTRGLVSAFSKYAGGRVSNRVVLNRFIGLIS